MFLCKLTVWVNNVGCILFDGENTHNVLELLGPFREIQQDRVDDLRYWKFKLKVLRFHSIADPDAGSGLVAFCLMVAWFLPPSM
jgi:hypothetical protein